MLDYHINKSLYEMSYNSFDYYRQLRQYQLHMMKLSNPEASVPSHEAFKPPKAPVDKKKQYERNIKMQEIQRENEHILNKLVKIGKRNMQASQSSPNLKLPSLKKEFSIPHYEQQNNLIAKKIIQTKSHIDRVNSLERNRTIEARKRNISKYVSQDGVVINRKRYIAELMLLKKMRVSQLMKK